MAASGYHEHAPPDDLAADVLCSWTGRIGDTGAPYTDRVLPDGCVDIIWDGTRLMVAGPDTHAVPIVPRPGLTFVGVRMRPGRAARVLGQSAAELTDQRPDLSDIWAPGAVADLQDTVAAAPGPLAVEAQLARAVRRRLADAPPEDRVVDGLVAELQPAPRRARGRIADLAATLGVTERSLHRRCTAAVGYGPKTLDRVLRFRRVLALADADPDAQLGTLAVVAGYADQAHLTRECRRLSGRTPSELFKTAP